MPNIKVGTDNNQSVELFYQDAGAGDPVVLIHGWPLSSAMWEGQIPALVEAGYRVIAYDRRGFGASDWTWNGNDYDTLASDLNEIINGLNLSNATLVGFSMGGGEVARYIATYGSARLKNVVLASAVTPYLMKADDNPDGVDPKVFEAIGEAIQTDRVQFMDEFTKQFYNWSTIGSNKVSKPAMEFARSIAWAASPRATMQNALAFSGTDFRSDLAKFDVPTLVIHGDDDQTVPFEASGKRSASIIKGAKLAVIEGGPHGVPQTHTDEFNRILLGFLQS